MTAASNEPADAATAGLLQANASASWTEPATRPLDELKQAAATPATRVIITTPVRVFGEGLIHALRAGSNVEVIGMAPHVAAMRELLKQRGADVVLVDVSAGIELEEIRLLAMEMPELKLLALGLVEQSGEVIRFAKAGFAGYIARDISLAELEPLLNEAVQGRVRCSADVAAGLMQALFRPEGDPLAVPPGAPLTRREGEILRLLGRGYSNKEIARELEMSAATAKNHVHNLLAKLNLSSRIEAARCVREKPWMAGPVG